MLQELGPNLIRHSAPETGSAARKYAQRGAI